MARLREKIPTDQNGKGTRPLSEAQRVVMDKMKRKRITIFRNEDGSLDTSGLSDEQRAALSDGGFPVPGGPSAAPGVAPDSPPPAFPPYMASMFLNVLVGIETAIVAPRMDLDAAKVRAVLEPAPPLAESIRDCATRVLNKYAGALGAWAEEIALASLLITWQAGAFSELRRLQAAAIEKKKGERPAPPDLHFTVEPPSVPKPPAFKMPSQPPKHPAATPASAANGAPRPGPATESAADTADNPFLTPEMEFVGA